LLQQWTKGAGGKYNPDRKEALELINIAASFDDVVKELLLLLTHMRIGKILIAIGFPRY